MSRLSLGEGDTPLYRSAVWENVWIKDERQNPTGTFKDRQAAAIVSKAVEEGAKGIVVASTGNTAVACAAYAAKAGLGLWAFLPARRRAQSEQQVEAFGGHVAIVGATYDETKVGAREFAEGEGLFYAHGMDYTAAMGAIACEIHDQLGRVPDWYVQAVSGGVGPVGVYQGFQECTAQAPKLLIVQAEGCSPMVQAARKDLAEVESVVPDTYAATLGTGYPAEAYRFLREVGAAFVMVSDEKIKGAVRRVALNEGLWVEPAAATAFAGLKRAFDDGLVPRDETVVINCSGR